MKINIGPGSLKIKKDRLSPEEWKAVIKYSTPNINVRSSDDHFIIIGLPQHLYAFLYAMSIKFDIDLM